jgi:cytochrome bd-type quinol oxidase subunit 2
MNNSTEKVKGDYRISMYIHLGIMGSLLVYIALVEGFGMKLSPYKDHASYLSSLRYIFYGITIVVIFTIRRINSLFKLKPITGKIEKNLNRLLRISIITSLLCEIPALLGLVYFLTKGIKKDFYYLVILSAVLLLLYFPRYSKWRPLAERGKQIED